MAKAKVKIDLSNDAFQSDDTCGEELARIFRDLADRVENKNIRSIGRSNMPILDVNGNTVGHFKVVAGE